MTQGLLLNNALAGALGRPDLAFSHARGIVASPPITVVGGSAGSSSMTSSESGMYPLGILIVVFVGYLGYAWWVRHHLA